MLFNSLNFVDFFFLLNSHRILINDHTVDDEGLLTRLFFYNRLIGLVTQKFGVNSRGMEYQLMYAHIYTTNEMNKISVAEASGIKPYMTI